MLKETFPKGKTVRTRDVLPNGTRWYAVVMEAPRKKLDDGYASMMCEVYGYEHECGSVYCREYEPCSVEEFERATAGEKRYFSGKLC